MADGGLAVLDGTHLRSTSLLLPIPDGSITGSELIRLAESEASSRLFGLPLPSSLKSAASLKLSETTYMTDDPESKTLAIQSYLLAVADKLRDEPIVVSILDGSALQLFLDDEDDFAMLAENLFTELDVEDEGKIGRSKIRTAVATMGVGMGVPSFSESSDLLNNILQKHGAEGEEQLGQAQFAQLLQPVLQDLADALAEKHVTVIQNIKVINGSKFRKILADKNLFDDITKRIFQDLGASKTGGGDEEKLRAILEAKGSELGLPPSESNEAVVLLYDQVFSEVGGKSSGFSNTEAFQEVMEVVFKKFEKQLEANPIFVDSES